MSTDHTKRKFKQILFQNNGNGNESVSETLLFIRGQNSKKNVQGVLETKSQCVFTSQVSASATKHCGKLKSTRLKWPSMAQRSRHISPLGRRLPTTGLYNWMRHWLPQSYITFKELLHSIHGLTKDVPHTDYQSFTIIALVYRTPSEYPVQCQIHIKIIGYGLTIEEPSNTNNYYQIHNTFEGCRKSKDSIQVEINYDTISSFITFIVERWM